MEIICTGSHGEKFEGRALTSTLATQVGDNFNKYERDSVQLALETWCKAFDRCMELSANPELLNQ
jgi:hypothetical protein